MLCALITLIAGLFIKCKLVDHTEVAYTSRGSRLSGLQIISGRAKKGCSIIIPDSRRLSVASHGELGEVAADRMIENVIGTMSLPVGVATNFVIDGNAYLVPFCVESSIVAAASNMAKRCLKNGGFKTNNTIL